MTYCHVTKLNYFKTPKFIALLCRSVEFLQITKTVNTSIGLSEYDLRAAK